MQSSEYFHGIKNRSEEGCSRIIRFLFENRIKKTAPKGDFEYKKAGLGFFCLRRESPKTPNKAGATKNAVAGMGQDCPIDQLSRLCHKMHNPFRYHGYLKRLVLFGVFCKVR